MSNQLVSDPETLKMLFNEPIFFVPEPAIAVDVEFSHIGDNQRNILILVNDPDNDVASEDGRLMLKNLLKHLNIGGKDFALVNYSKYPTASFEQLNAFYSVRSALIFGVNPLALGLDINANNAEVNGASLYFTASLSNMQLADKKSLFEILKNFKI